MFSPFIHSHNLDVSGPAKPGTTRKMLGSPRQLENAVPTSKNPHGVWVWKVKLYLRSEAEELCIQVIVLKLLHIKDTQKSQTYSRRIRVPWMKTVYPADLGAKKMILFLWKIYFELPPEFIGATEPEAPFYILVCPMSLLTDSCSNILRE